MLLRLLLHLLLVAPDLLLNRKKKFGLVHIPIGDLWTEVAAETDIGVKAKEYMNTVKSLLLESLLFQFSLLGFQLKNFAMWLLLQR